MRDELPHSVACVIEEIYPDPEDDERTVVHAVIYVERESQKGIVIGKKGARLRKVGQRARQGMQRVLDPRLWISRQRVIGERSKTLEKLDLRCAHITMDQAGRYNLGEADRIIVLFTRRHGLVRAVAKGVRCYLIPLVQPFMRRY